MIVVLDISCFTHALERPTDYRNRTVAEVRGIKRAQLLWLLGCGWLDGLVADDEPLYPLVVRDAKPYWRTAYLKQRKVYERIPRVGKRGTALKPQPVHYKGGRKESSKFYRELVTDIDRMLEALHVPQLRRTGYEADDWASAVCRSMATRPRSRRDRILLATLDSDWLGLVVPDPVKASVGPARQAGYEVGWYCLHGHAPRMRSTMPAINSWAQRRLGCELERPRDIWAVKSAAGDKSDNLPPGSPIEVIDLLEPPAQYDLLQQKGIAARVSSALDAGWQLPANKAHAASAVLRRNGIRPYPRPFDPTRDAYHD